ncbi:DEAD/DEAH box helicase [Agitococcus lubricus]|uniref:4a-hydroxytetrahydrobiopterin dehydratase n=1 Tax=Agitococcus lubricus TaxID=1077255 RepID=A0A2T5J495_9GAMM|nr:DEAD/DEAH box helicase [Agitococcus lubricus]PTQ91376.1 4a-hydroxytetrahydrobiopterin dehydratase [Agitococcus lubricus]
MTSTPTFSHLGIDSLLVKAVNALNYQQPTPIQQTAIPAILQGRDVVAGAETGSGKTAAFALPLLQRLSQQAQTSQAKGNQIRALVLAPTRELAIQIGQAINSYGQYLQPRLKVCTVFGGVSINPQMLALRGGADIVVATTGRLLDLMAHNALKCDALAYLVLDEADKMLGLGFSEELTQILKVLPKKRQNLLFSATFPPELQQLIEQLLHQPLEINLAKQDENLIEQHVYVVEQERKNAALIHLIHSENWQQVLVFASAKNTCNRLVLKLAKAGIQAAAFHGDLSQGARNKALEDFKAKKIRVLIATDVAARGIDIQQLPYVVNFELPRSANDYIHRIGRTGRAGQQGYAVALITEEDEEHFRLIEKRMKKRLPREQLLLT